MLPCGRRQEGSVWSVCIVSAQCVSAGNIVLENLRVKENALVSPRSYDLIYPLFICSDRFSHSVFISWISGSMMASTHCFLMSLLICLNSSELQEVWPFSHLPNCAMWHIKFLEIQNVTLIIDESSVLFFDWFSQQMSHWSEETDKSDFSCWCWFCVEWIVVCLSVFQSDFNVPFTVKAGQIGEWSHLCLLLWIPGSPRSRMLNCQCYEGLTLFNLSHPCCWWWSTQ